MSAALYPYQKKIFFRKRKERESLPALSPVLKCQLSRTIPTGYGGPWDVGSQGQVGKDLAVTNRNKQRGRLNLRDFAALEQGFLCIEKQVLQL